MVLASRHDHFPRADHSRVAAIRKATADLATRWREEDEASGGLAAALAAAGGDPATVIARLFPWLVDTRWLDARLEQAVALLASDAFARPPLRIVGGGGGSGGLILAEHGSVRLSLQMLPFEAAGATPATTLFVPGHAAIRVLAAGRGSMTLHHVALSADEEAGAFVASAAARCRSDPPRRLVADEIFLLDTSRTGFTISGATGDVLLLELVVQPPMPLPMRAYDLTEACLAHASASRRDSSFRQMALAMLRTMGRHDSVALFVEATEAEDFAVRWSAARELVALDADAARPVLARMEADDPHPEVRAAASATLALVKGLRPCRA